MYVPNQWETTLQCNIVSHSLIGWGHTQNDPWCHIVASMNVAPEQLTDDSELVGTAIRVKRYRTQSYIHCIHCNDQLLPFYIMWNIKQNHHTCEFQGFKMLITMFKQPEIFSKTREAGSIGILPNDLVCKSLGMADKKWRQVSTLQWCHYERKSPDCLLKRLFRRRSKKTLRLPVTPSLAFVKGIHRWPVISCTKGQ